MAIVAAVGPRMYITDVAFPPVGTPAGAVHADNLREIQGFVAPHHFEVADEVDASSSRWRLYNSIQTDIVGVRQHSPGDIKLCLLEHIWPPAHVRHDREVWHSRLLRAVQGQWPDAVVCMVQRNSGGIGAIDQLVSQLPLKRNRVVVRKVERYYVPQMMDVSLEDAPISGTDDGGAIFILPKRMEVSTLEVFRYLQQPGPVSIPFVCRLVMARARRHILQFGAWNLASSVAILREVAREL